MTNITIYQNHEKNPVGFTTKGHAGYADAGEDIVCAGISSIVINTINSIEEFTDAHFTLDMNEHTGEIDFRIQSEPENDELLLLKSMILGLQGIQNNYGKKFLRLHFKEV